MLYTDICKAFDSVVHVKLIAILTSYGVNPALLSWLENFLSGREQIVIVNDSLSSPCGISSGIPQGSIIGPLLFLIYLNDIDVCVSNLDNTGISLFADDAKFYGSDPDNLQNTLNNFEVWLDNRQLKLAKNKCFSLTISKISNTPQFFLGNTPISSTNSMKDLGIYVTSNLKWNTHIAYIYNNAIAPSYHILKFTKTKNIWTLIQLFKTYVRPKIESNTQIWSPYLIQDIKKIESIQKYFTKVVCNRCNIQFNSYSDRLQKLNLHSLQYRRVYFDITFMFKIINGTSGLNFSDFFRQRPTTYNLRYNQNNVETIDHFRDNGWLNSFFPRVAKLWNGLPSTITTITRLELFKKALNKFDLNKLTTLMFP